MKGFMMGFVFAARGIAAGCRGRNFKVMLGVMTAVLGLGWWLGLRGGQWTALILSMGMVLALEMVNTAGEMLVDILSPGHDARYGQVKDVLAGAVLLAAVMAAVVGTVVLGPGLLARLTG